MALMERVDSVLQRDITALCGYVELIAAGEMLLEKRVGLYEDEQQADRITDALKVLDEIESRLCHILGFDDCSA